VMDWYTRTCTCINLQGYPNADAPLGKRVHNPSRPTIRGRIGQGDQASGRFESGRPNSQSKE
jgi:hypothetical protein